MVSFTMQSLEQLKVSDGVNLVALDTYTAEITNAEIELKKLLIWEKTTLRIKFSIILYINTLIQNITSRFEDKSIMSAFCIFNPASVPSDVAEVQVYGNDEIEKLSKHNKLTNTFAEPVECLAE